MVDSPIKNLNVYTVYIYTHVNRNILSWGTYRYIEHCDYLDFVLYLMDLLKNLSLLNELQNFATKRIFS